MRERDIIAHCVRFDHRQLIVTINSAHNSRFDSPETGTSSHARIRIPKVTLHQILKWALSVVDPGFLRGGCAKLFWAIEKKIDRQSL